MKFRATPTNAKRRGGFTLAEVLAALVFMAIVIPTAVHGLRVASMAGQMGIRKVVAARIAERELNELLVARLWQSGSQNGTVRDGPLLYRWTMRREPWSQTPPVITTGASGAATLANSSSTLNVLQLLTVEVVYPVQGRDYAVRLSTLVDPTVVQ